MIDKIIRYLYVAILRRKNLQLSFLYTGKCQIKIFYLLTAKVCLLVNNLGFSSV